MTTKRNGQSLIEILVASGIGIILVTGAVTLIGPALKSSTVFTRQSVGVGLGSELLKQVKSWGEADWSRIASLATSSANAYYLNATSSPFSVATGTQYVLVSTSTYLRYFYLDDVGRDAAGFIAAAGGANDPSTKKVTAVYGYANGPTSTMVMYIARFPHRMYMQTDWSGGGGVNGPATTTGTTFSTSSNVNYTTTTGSILLSI